MTDWLLCRTTQLRPQGDTQRPARAYLPSLSSCPQPVTERLLVAQHHSSRSQETCKISGLPCSLDLSMFAGDGSGPNDVYNDAINNPQHIAKTSWSRLIDRFAFHMNTEPQHDQQFICTLNSYCNCRQPIMHPRNEYLTSYVYTTVQIRTIGLLKVEDETEKEKKKRKVIEGGKRGNKSQIHDQCCRLAC